MSHSRRQPMMVPPRRDKVIRWIDWLRSCPTSERWLPSFTRRVNALQTSGTARPNPVVTISETLTLLDRNRASARPTQGAEPGPSTPTRRRVGVGGRRPCEPWRHIHARRRTSWSHSWRSRRSTNRVRHLRHDVSRRTHVGDLPVHAPHRPRLMTHKRMCSGFTSQFVQVLSRYGHVRLLPRALRVRGILWASLLRSWGNGPLPDARRPDRRPGTIRIHSRARQHLARPNLPTARYADPTGG